MIELIYEYKGTTEEERNQCGVSREVVAFVTKIPSCV